MVSLHIWHWQVSIKVPQFSTYLLQISDWDLFTLGCSKNVRQEVAMILRPGSKLIQHHLPCILLVKASHFTFKGYGNTLYLLMGGATKDLWPFVIYYRTNPSFADSQPEANCTPVTSDLLRLYCTWMSPSPHKMHTNFFIHIWNLSHTAYFSSNTTYFPKLSLILKGRIINHSILRNIRAL